MKTLRMTMIVVSLLSLCLPALGQLDLIGGADSASEATVSIFSHEADGNQAWVREYTGDYEAWGLELLDVYGYNGPAQYWLEVRDLLSGDDDVRLALSHRNLLGFSLGTSALTHRLDRTPAINPFLNDVSDDVVTFRTTETQIIPAFEGDTFVDLSPDGELGTDRRVNTLGLDVSPGRNQHARLVAGWWQENETGTRQLQFRARADTAGVILNRQRAAAAIPIDRTTDEATIGADLQLQRDTVVNYRYTNTQYDDDGTRPGGVLATVNPLDRLTSFDSKTGSSVIKARSKLGARAYLTGSHTNKSRKNETAVVPAGFYQEGSFRNNRVDIDSTDLAVTYLAAEDLSLTGRWRKYDQKSFVLPIFEEVSEGQPGDDPQNQSLSRKTTSVELTAAYTGIPRTYVKAAYERRDTDRESFVPHALHEEFEHPFISESTESNILRLSARYHPSLRMSFSAGYENWNTDNPGYAGLPTDRSRLNLNATYLVRDNFAVFGDYVRSNESNDQVRIPVDELDTIVTPPSPPLTDEQQTEYLESRELGAGQGYDNELTTWNIGGWYALSSRLTLDGFVGGSSIDASALWVVGTDAGFPPHLEPDFVPYRADSRQWSLGANYRLSRQWQVYGRFLRVNSEGKTILDPDIFPGNLTTWTPFDVLDTRWTIGASYRVSPKDRLLLDLSVGDWDDDIDSANDGRYTLWRVAWSSQF